ncbi:MAG: hypothetical protein R8M45_06865, partial [Ghiorsea sp.]
MFSLMRNWLWFGCLLGISGVTSAAGLSPAQMLMAQQAGVDIGGIGSSSSSQSKPLDYPSVLDTAAVQTVINTPVSPSSIEQSVWGRLNL